MKLTYRKGRRGAVTGALLIVFTVAGCAGQFGHFKAGEPVRTDTGEGVVFGRIVFIENGREQTPYPAFWESKPTMYLWQSETERRFQPPVVRISGSNVEQDGSFFWIVPIGTYILTDIQFDYFINPRVVFQVPVGGKAYYLGTLNVSLETKPIVARQYVERINNIWVTDDFENAQAMFLKRNPDAAGMLVKKLMIHDHSIPTSLSAVPQQTLATVLANLGLAVLPLLQTGH